MIRCRRTGVRRCGAGATAVKPTATAHVATASTTSVRASAPAAVLRECGQRRQRERNRECESS